MKKITNEEFNKLLFQPKGRDLQPIVKEILKLGLNEGLIMAPKEWILKMNPSTYFVQNADKFSGMFFRVRKLANGEGYAVIRVS